MNLNIVPASGVAGKKTAGYVMDINGASNLTVRDIQMTDPYQGIFVTNDLQDRFEDIYIYTTVAGTLFNGIYLYGTDIDDFFTNVYGASSFAVPGAFLHIRNRASGIRFDNFSWESNNNTAGNGGTGILFDCGTAPPLGDYSACTQSQGAATSRPELIHFDKTYIESTYQEPAINFAGASDVRFQNYYLATSLQGILMSGESTAVSFDNGIIGNMWEQCVALNQTSAGGPGYANFSLTNSELNNCSQAGPQAYPAVEIAPGGTVNSINIQGNRIGHNTYPAFSNDSGIGVKLDGQSSYVRVIGNDFTSVFNSSHTPIITVPIYVTNSAGGVGNVFANNTAYSGIVPYSTVSTVSTAGCAINPGTTGSVCTATFTISQPDANYTVTGCNVINSVSGPAYVGSVFDLTAGYFQVLETAGNTVAVGGGTIYCTVTHQ